MQHTHVRAHHPSPLALPHPHTHTPPGLPLPHPPLLQLPSPSSVEYFREEGVLDAVSQLLLHTLVALPSNATVPMWHTHEVCIRVLGAAFKASPAARRTFVSRWFRHIMTSVLQDAVVAHQVCVFMCVRLYV